MNWIYVLQTSYAPSFAKIRIEETSHSQIQRRWSFWNLLYLLGWFWRRGQVTDFAMRPRLSFQGKFIEGFWHLFKKSIQNLAKLFYSAQKLQFRTILYLYKQKFLSNFPIQLKHCKFEPFCFLISSEFLMREHTLWTANDVTGEDPLEFKVWKDPI